MEIGFSYLTAAYVVFALVNSLLVSYSLLRYEPQDRDTVAFVTAVLLFLVVSLLLSGDLSTLVVEGVERVGLLRTVGAVTWWLSIFGFVLLMGYRLLS